MTSWTSFKRLMYVKFTSGDHEECGVPQGFTKKPNTYACKVFWIPSNSEC